MKGALNIMKWDIAYPAQNVAFPCSEFTKYTLYINSETKQVVKVEISYLSKKVKGELYHADTTEKEAGEEGFDELVRRVFEALQKYNWPAICDIKEEFPNLYMQLLNS